MQNSPSSSFAPHRELIYFEAAQETEREQEACNAALTPATAHKALLAAIRGKTDEEN